LEVPCGNYPILIVDWVRVEKKRGGRGGGGEGGERYEQPDLSSPS